MKINQEFFDSIKPILKKLKEKVGNDFVVFGSAPLYLLGVVDFDKKINDIDIALSDAKRIPKEAKVVTFQGNKKQQFHKIVIDDVIVDIGCQWEGWPEQDEFFKRIFTEPIEVEGFKFANLNVVEAWKTDMVREYNREKDRVYLQKIAAYKLKQKDLS